ncbi:hypothetical protein BBO99_00002227 [Phytophthora kernoviae]|uniref:Protein kinase domain-containing protein n=2 Tax=Phytophthora kernoviae TaxID=325452 RepID=A0A3R7I003_9STRA|nr:hypothetical protein G195_002450 [Phytophthora kernoviae 00238/432]KAG2529815.1 hypothetical protein JM16_001765 [Phytophthora kernoviae]KAG2531203.1 hypothetical protein JM18_001752 [Phytophthora kernoviae]RLN10623.1 hypothetical protein BBI17_001852 [Phytophthora kernoviae]RLN83341.1 hypothetical protein BBO99_00002227 [Phytophthora kernoviae]
MLESALEFNDVECGQRMQSFHIERGTLVTVSIEPSTRFGVAGEDCKSFRWRGDITGVSFDLFRVPTRSVHQEDEKDADELCIAKIVAGTKVSMLYIRLQADMTQADVGVARSSDLTLLDARMEHVASNLRDIPGEELELIRPIGHGAFGDAVLARWKSTSQEVVVKTMNQDAYRNSDALAEFRHEAEVMNLLGKHPHVVELLGVTSTGSTTTGGGNDSQSIALVTEYLTNGSLEDVLGMKADTGAFATSDPSTSLFSRTIMARDAAHGLANIHQGHFLHCDIAARNCLVDKHFRVKVCDFGLSRRLNNKNDFGPSGSFLFDDTRHGFGPIKWMAPESITPPHLFSTYSDSYMFGTLLYEIFSGHAPFPKISSRDAAALILEGHHVPIPSSLPIAHRHLMEQCFDMHPLRRPSMDQIYNTLDQWENPDLGMMKSLRLDACTSLKGVPPQERQQACQAGFSEALDLAKDAAVFNSAEKEPQTPAATQEAATATNTQGSQGTSQDAGTTSSEPNKRKVNVKKVNEPDRRNLLEDARNEAASAFAASDDKKLEL